MINRLSRRPGTPLMSAAMVIIGASVIQFSAALVKPIFRTIGPAATSSWRFLIGAVVLMALTRPKLHRWTKRQWVGAIALGLSTAFMNQTFFQAISRIHLGTAVALEFTGPFLVAALGHRSWRHFGFIVIALIGVLLLAHPGGALNPWGVVFALCAAAGWAAYTFASHAVGDATSGFEGLAVAMSIGALATFPMIPGSLHPLIDSGLMPRMVLASIMAVVIGFAAEMQALRGLPPRTVSVLLSLDPAIAFVIGWIVLSQAVTPLDLLGTLCVVGASIAVTRDASSDHDVITP